MSAHEEKLRRGFGLIERAESDSDLLGVGLLAVYSALEAQLRGALSSHPDIPDTERQRLIRRELGWVAVAELAQRYLGLTDEQRQLVLDATEVRRSFIQGAPFRWRSSDVLRFSRFVERFCGAEGLLDEVLLERRHERRVKPAPAAPAEEPASPNAWIWNLVRLAIIVAVFGAIGAGIAATYTWVDDTLREFNASSPAAAPTAVGQAQPVIAPTAQLRTGRVVNLGGGPGWLHEQPRFDSDTMPPRLEENDTVRLIDEPTVDADGTTWVLVEFQSYRGWSPSNNIAVVTAQ